MYMHTLNLLMNFFATTVHPTVLSEYCTGSWVQCRYDLIIIIIYRLCRTNSHFVIIYLLTYISYVVKIAITKLALQVVIVKSVSFEIEGYLS